MADTAAWTGFAKANDRSSVTRVGLPSPAAIGVLLCAACGDNAAVGWGDCAEAGWNRHTVFNDLNKGVDDAATA